jgi:hypothetical protein
MRCTPRRNSSSSDSLRSTVTRSPDDAAVAAPATVVMALRDALRAAMRAVLAERAAIDAGESAEDAMLCSRVASLVDCDAQR